MKTFALPKIEFTKQFKIKLLVYGATKCGTKYVLRLWRIHNKISEGPQNIIFDIVVNQIIISCVTVSINYSISKKRSNMGEINW